MKKSTFTLLLMIMLTSVGMAQITIDKSDMPNSYDTFRFSNAVIITNLKLKQTGINQFWDYSNLKYTSQTKDTFGSMKNIPLSYKFTFQLYGANIIKFDKKLNELVSLIPVNTPISDIYYFYKKNSSMFGYLGYGASVAGMPIPVKADNPDVVYKFPMNYGNVDSSVSNITLSIPSTIYHEQYHKRVNRVDGWGKLKTPFGLFDVLRVKSVNYYSDSMEISKIDTAFRINRKVIEYKWLAKNQGVPLLTIQGNEIFGVFSPTKIYYRDIFRKPLFANNEYEYNKRVSINVYPNPSKTGVFYVNIGNYNEEKEINIKIFDINGKIILNKTISSFDNINLCKLDISKHKKGVYILKVKGEKFMEKQNIMFIN